MSDASVKVSKELQAIAKRLDKELDKAAGQRVSFSLFVWTDGVANYIANTTDRQEVCTALTTVMGHWNQGLPDIPAHKRN